MKPLDVRKQLIQSMHKGDVPAFHALHDWHEEYANTDHPYRHQDQDIVALRQYVEDPNKDRGYVLPEHDHQTTQEQRVRAAAEHLTETPPWKGSLVHHRYNEHDEGRSGVLEEYQHPSQPYSASFHRVVVTDRDNKVDRYYISRHEVENHASNWLRNYEKQQQGQKSLEEIWKSL